MIERWWLIVNRETGRFSRVVHTEALAYTNDPLFKVVEVVPVADSPASPRKDAT